ncbi:hypothetical protein ACWD48_20290 [Streptomyces sp. NPDC002519]
MLLVEGQWHSDDGYHSYDSRIPIAATTLDLLREHGPAGPAFWRFGRDHRQPLRDAIGNPRRDAYLARRRQAGSAAGHAYLVVRRHRYTRELSFCRCHSTAPVSLADLVNIICNRWKIEEDFQGAKGTTGRDQGQVTCWNSWMRWSLISLMDAAVLTVTRARTHTADTAGIDLVLTSPRELLAVLRAAVIPMPHRDLDHVLHWSAWRRRHQHRAAVCHRHWNNVTAAAIT